MKNNFIVLMLSILISFQGFAQDKKEKLSMRDTLDGKLDMSNWILNYEGFLPVPMIITEPAVGIGGGLFAVFMEHPKEKGVTDKKGIASPPIMTFGGGFYTQNGTYMMGAGRFQRWNHDKVRLMAFGGYANINLDYYQLGDLSLEDDPLEFNFKGYAIAARPYFRIASSNFLFDLDLTYYACEITPENTPNNEVEEEIEDFLNQTIENGSIGIGINWETRDNVFTPNNGFYAYANYKAYQNWTLSDYSYNIFEVNFQGYSNKLKNPILGLRYNAQFSTGDVPTFFKPFVNMRGVPMMKYQGDHIMTIETEERIDINFRNAIVVFGGAAFTSNAKDAIDFNYQTWTAGTGFRYKIARLLNLYSGVDFAFSEDQFAWYITFANAWR